VDLARIHYYLWLASPAVYAVWAIRLFTLGLASRYPLLLTFFAADTVMNLGGYAVYNRFGLESSVYRWYFIFSRTVYSTLLLLVLTEVYQRMIEGLAGLRRLGQLLATLALALAAFIVFGSLFLDSNALMRTIIHFWIVQERSIFLSLSIFAVGLVGFAVYFHLSPPRNVLVILAVFGLSFVAQAFLRALLALLGDGFRPARDLLASLEQNLCFLAGALAFSKSGEQAQGPAPGLASPSRGSEAVDRLAAINRALMRAFRL
jgi:hypothetical protein